MTTPAILDGIGYIAGDAALAMLITTAALLTYARVAFEDGALRYPWPRLIMGVGFTVWAMRFWYTLGTGGDVLVAPLSMMAIAMVAGGYCTVQLLAIQRCIFLMRHPLFCLQKPDAHCQREDRIEALREET